MTVTSQGDDSRHRPFGGWLEFRREGPEPRSSRLDASRLPISSWVTRLRRDPFFALVALLAAGIHCASNTLSGVDEPDFGEVVGHYRTLGSNKALALATEANGRWAYGARFASDSREKAIEDALRACANQAYSGGMRARCLLFAVENEPAAETVRGCLAGKITSRRCAMQRRHQRGLNEP